MLSKKLKPDIVPKIGRAMKGKRTVHRVTFAPHPTAIPGDILKITPPPMEKDVVFLPNSLFLSFQLEVDAGVNTNHVVFNVSRNLVEKFTVRFGGHTISDIRRYDLYQGYHDLLTVDEDMMMGITSDTYRKIRVGAHGASTVAKEVKYCRMYGKTYYIPLSHEIIDEYGCFNSGALRDNIEFELTLAPAGNVVTTSNNKLAHSYKLNNIKLEYTTVRNQDLAEQILEDYNTGKTFHLEDVHLMKVEGPLNFSTKKDMIIRINRNVKTMKGVLFLFTKTYAAGVRNTEEFINPEFSNVQVTINGTSNSLYAQGIKLRDVWEDVMKKVGKVHEDFKQLDFQNDKYAFWIDLRAAQDDMLHGDGETIGEQGEGLVIEFDFGSNSPDANLNCHVFVVSDSALAISNGRIQNYLIR